jgi:hypothetical protein
MDSAASVQKQIKEKYGSAARAVAEPGGFQACCDPVLRCCDPITTNLYSADEKGLIPDQAVLASLGCGNPTALIELRAGETVLDLGSGGGIDVLLSAQRVGPTGKVYAGPGARKSAAGGRLKRRVSEGRNRAHPPA